MGGVGRGCRSRLGGAAGRDAGGGGACGPGVAGPTRVPLPYHKAAWAALAWAEEQGEAAEAETAEGRDLSSPGGLM